MCPALSQREQDGATALSDHDVGLTIAGADAFLNDPRSLIERNAAPDLAPALIAPVMLPALLAAAGAGMEITALALVQMNMLVNPFSNDTQTLLPRQPAADLFRIPVLG